MKNLNENEGCVPKSRRKNFIKKIAAWLIVMLIIYVGYAAVLAGFVVHFNNLPPYSRPPDHPVFWRLRAVAPLMLKQLDSSDLHRCERALAFFIGLNEVEAVREKMVEWVRDSDKEKRVLAYRYLSRNHVKDGYVREDMSWVDPRDYDLFINAWNLENSHGNVYVLAEIFSLSDIPCIDLSTNTELRDLYFRMIPMLRKNNNDEILEFRKNLGGADQRTRQLAEALLSGVEKLRDVTGKFQISSPDLSEASEASVRPAH